MDDIRFASPWILLLLAGVPLLALYAWPRRGATPGLPFGTLGAALTARPTWRVRAEPSLIGLRLLGIALLVVAIARPQRGEASTTTEGEGIDIVLAFDVSSSMTQQFGGNRTRIDAAKSVLSSFIERRENDRVALVAFQGSSITLSPLTTDYDAVAQSVTTADQLRLADGTAIGTALGESVNVLRDSNATSRIVILLTDGENNAGDVEPLSAARIAERLGERVYTVGVLGFEGQNPTRRASNVDEQSLRKIAEVTGGTYSPSQDQASLEAVYANIDALEKSRFEGRTLTRFNDIAPYFLAAAAAAFALEIALRSSLFRRVA
ncbi:MAG TPA: VWA domain-containing protein [Dehalococcoidia bacterium]